jgi:carboxypeptidase T
MGFTQDKYTKVRVPVPTANVRQFVIDRLALDHYETKDNAMEVVLNQNELAILASSGYRYEVLIDDVVKYTTEFNRREGDGGASSRAPFATNCGTTSTIFQTPTSFGTGGTLRLGAASGTGYFKYSEMITKMQALATAYPSFVSIYTIGLSEQGQNIYGVKISDNVATDESEPEVLFTGLQHAREAIGGTSLIFFMQYVAENYAAGNDHMENLVNNREIFIIPCLNPDGYAYNYGGSSASYPTTGGGLWRKNRRLISGSTYGVDINRNYGIDWGNCSGATTSCGSSTTSDETYYGPSAFSEKETKALRDFVYAHHFVAAIDQHCYGPYFSLPFGRPSLHTMNTDDANFYSYVPALMGTYNCHRAGNSPQTVNYEVAGGIKDWLLMGDIGVGTKGKIYGMTGEAGGGDFWAPISQILTLCRQNCFQNLQLAYAAGSYFNIEDQNDIAVTAAGSFSFLLRSVGLKTSPVTVSLVPIEGLKTVGSAASTTISTYYGTYTGSVPYTLSNSIQDGQRIRYAWKVESDGVISYDTVVKIYNPVTLLSDDMEGTFSTNWSTTSNVNTTAGKWGFTTTAAYAGTHSLTESPSGNYTTSTTRTVLYKSTFDLSDAQHAYLSFWVKHRSENCNDKLQVQFSTDGTSYTAVCGTHTVAENSGTLAGVPALTGIRENWTRVIYDLTAYIGNPGVYMRFQFTSDGDGGSFAYELDDGFYIDNIKVVKTPLEGSVLGVKFLKVTGKLQPDNTVKVDWEAITDSDHDHFDVERSSNGVDFTIIGRGNTQPPYRFIDMAPRMGSNYYRIRQVDKNGRISYSRIVVVDLSHRMQLSVFPNPVRDNISLNVVATDGAALRLEVSDATGRMLYNATQVAGRGSSNLTLPTAGWQAGVYILRVRAEDGTLLSSHRVIKL